MGLFDIFKPKETVLANRRIHAMHGHVQDAFSTLSSNIVSLNANMKQQQEWLKYLHQNHLSLHSQHTNHKEATKTEVTKVNSWITFLHKALQKQDKHVAKLQEIMEAYLKKYEQDFAQIYTHLETVHKKAMEKPAVQIIQKEPDYAVVSQKVAEDLNVEIEATKAEIKKEVSEVFESKLEELQQQKEKLQEILLSLQQKQEQEKQMQQPTLIPAHAPAVLSPHFSFEEPISIQWSRMTNPEQKLLNLLISEADPLSYTKISQLTGHSINTIRVNMNILKKKGFVEESALPSGVKLFSVTNKEKIKKMYNVQVL